MAQTNALEALQDPKNWKHTQSKQYEIYMCMPDIGEPVYNNLELCSYTTDENCRFVLSGTVGEQWTIDSASLARKYMFADGAPIDEQTIAYRMTMFNRDTRVITNKAPMMLPSIEELDKYNQGAVMDWQLIRTKPGEATSAFAFHLPLSVVNYPVQTSWGSTLLANAPGVSHGTGDFLVCNDVGGMPDFNDMRVVNGEVFPKTYDMRAFPNLSGHHVLSNGARVNSRGRVVDDGTIPKPASLIEKYHLIRPGLSQGTAASKSTNTFSNFYGRAAAKLRDLGIKVGEYQESGTPGTVLFELGHIQTRLNDTVIVAEAVFNDGEYDEMNNIILREVGTVTIYTQGKDFGEYSKVFNGAAECALGISQSYRSMVGRIMSEIKRDGDTVVSSTVDSRWYQGSEATVTRANTPAASVASVTSAAPKTSRQKLKEARTARDIFDAFKR